jgi:hypothetical protein
MDLVEEASLAARTSGGPADARWRNCAKSAFLGFLYELKQLILFPAFKRKR